MELLKRYRSTRERIAAMLLSRKDYVARGRRVAHTDGVTEVVPRFAAVLPAITSVPEILGVWVMVKVSGCKKLAGVDFPDDLPGGSQPNAGQIHRKHYSE